MNILYNSYWLKIKCDAKAKNQGRNIERTNVREELVNSKVGFLFVSSLYRFFGLSLFSLLFY